MTAFSHLDEEGRREYWAALALRNTPGLGARQTCLLLKRFGSAYRAFFNRERWPELSPRLRKPAASPDDAWRAGARPEWDAARKMDVEIILWTDSLYPERLRQIPDAPALLYARGDVGLLRAPLVAVVGSRECSPAAADIASRLAGDLSASGITVVSGMAAGVDAYAQRAALKQAGRSIAVMATGIDVIYPASHFRLYEDLSAAGLIVTEEPPHAKPQPGSFPVRNRIISGLSLGVVVAEALSLKSGSLITATLAAEQGRNVYVPASDLFRGGCREGTKKLIEDGAMQIYRADDIMADLFPQLSAGKEGPDHAEMSEDLPARGGASPEGPGTEAPESPPAVPEQDAEAVGDGGDDADAAALRRRIEDEGEQKPRAVPLKRRPILAVPKTPSVPLTEEEDAILAILRKGPVSADDLLYAVRDSGTGITWSAQGLNAVLMVLEVKKLVRRLSDSRYEAS